MAASLAAYQKQVDDWIKSIGKGYFPPLSMLAQLTEELGETARVMNRVYGKQKAKPEEAKGDLADELSGMLFAITCLANDAGIDLSEALERHLAKITARDKNRF